jgi:hypothetical protein
LSGELFGPLASRVVFGVDLQCITRSPIERAQTQKADVWYTSNDTKEDVMIRGKHKEDVI